MSESASPASPLARPPAPAAPSSRRHRPKPTLQERYRAFHHLPDATCTEHLLRRSLYPHARWLRPLVKMLWPEAFALDWEFLAGLSTLRSRREFPAEANVFFDRSHRERRWRHALRLRVSVQRAQREIDRVWSHRPGP